MNHNIWIPYIATLYSLKTNVYTVAHPQGPEYQLNTYKYTNHVDLLQKLRNFSTTFQKIMWGMDRWGWEWGGMQLCLQ